MLKWSNIWILLFIFVSAGVIVTLLPIIQAFLEKVDVNKAPKWFSDADSFEEQKDRLVDHELRLAGTLEYWKNKAAANQRLHSARIIWSLASGVSLPVLIRFYDNENPWSVAFITTLTVFSGFIVAFAQAMKAEEMYRGFRECESDYYDTARALLNAPALTPEERKIQVDSFFTTVEKIRKAGRKIETRTPPSGLD